MPITAPTLSIVDSADGTGGTAVLVGGSSSATNTLSALKVDGDLGSNEWTSLGSRSGEGSVSFTLEKGYYWFKIDSVLSTEAVVSNLVYQNITDGEDAVMEQCLLAIQARIQGLLLEDMPVKHVMILKAPTEKPADIPEGEDPYPMVMIMPFGQEQEAGGPLVRDDLFYPFLVILIDADERNQELNRGKYLKWRQQVLRAFREQHLPGVSNVLKTKVQPQAILDPAAWFSSPGRWMSSVQLNILAREPRGFST